MPTNDNTRTRAPEAPAQPQIRAIFVEPHRGWDVTVYREGNWYVADGVFGGFHLVAPDQRFERASQALAHIRVAIDLEELRLFGRLRPHRRDAADVALQALRAELEEQHLAELRARARRLAGQWPAVDVNDPDLPVAVKGGR